MKNLKQYIRSKIYESLMNEEMATKDVNSTMSTTSGNEKISSQPYQSMSAYDTQQNQQPIQSKNVEAPPGEPPNWPQELPIYVGPNDGQMWVHPGPPPEIFVFVYGPNGPVYLRFTRQTITQGTGGLNQIFNWTVNSWNGNNWDLRNSNTNFGKIMNPLFPGWRDPTAPPPGWDIIPSENEGGGYDLNIPGQPNWNYEYQRPTRNL